MPRKMHKDEVRRICPAGFNEAAATMPRKMGFLKAHIWIVSRRFQLPAQPHGIDSPPRRPLGKRSRRDRAPYAMATGRSIIDPIMAEHWVRLA
jgi:hypothetical protein